MHSSTTVSSVIQLKCWTPSLVNALLCCALVFTTLAYGDQVVLQHSSYHQPAGLPVANPTHSFWLYGAPDANPFAKHGSEGSLTGSADVCIIGGGITGLSTAYTLSLGRPNMSVAIFEARDFCSGATGRNGGHVTPTTFLGFTELERRYDSVEAAKSIALERYTTTRIAEIIHEHDLADAVHFVTGGHITMFTTEESYVAALADYDNALAAGVNLSMVSHLSSEEMESRYGISRPAAMSTGHNIWPLRFVTQLFKLARSNSSAPDAFNLTLHTNTPVTFVSEIAGDTNDGRRWMLATHRGDVTCSYVVHATNAYASHLLPYMSGPVGIIPKLGQLIAVRADASLDVLTNASWSTMGSEYWHPRAFELVDGKPLVILGGAIDENSRLYVTNDSFIDGRVTSFLNEFLPREFPGKFEQGREPEMEWSGILSYTAMGDPFVGPVIKAGQQMPGMYISAGYHGHGMPRALACAEVVAGMILAEMKSENWTAPSWLPERFLTWTRPGL
ncbi:DAO-domain-containing protein [Fistulina hepatica ATCC 64428]|nr:DAO-domain-containing protein [Fistulina hepatica ATCC 64428]